MPSKLDCDNTVPKELRAKYFAKWELHDRAEPLATTAECEVGIKDNKMGDIEVDCHSKAGQNIGPSVKVLKDALPGAQDLAGVGLAAIISRDPNKTFVNAWDDDSGCVVTMRLPNAIDVAAFAKDLMAYLPPKS